MIKNILKLTFFILLLSSGFAFSQDTTKVLEEITITSSTYRADEKSPFSFKNLKKEEWNWLNYGQEPAFILSQQSPSITTYTDAGSYQGYTYYRLRGIDQTRINMTLDGVPLNEPEDQGVYFSNYPDFLNSVSAIQIQRGVGTSKNGVASYAGSMEFTSPNLREEKRLQLGVDYGSYNSYRFFGEFNSGVKNDKAFYIRASHLNSDGYKEHSKHTSQSIFYSAALFKDKAHWKILGFLGNQANDMAWLGISEEVINRNPRANANAEQEKDEFLQKHIQLQNKLLLNENSILNTTIYYNYLNGNYDFDLNNFLGLPSTTELFNYDFESHFVGILSNYNYEKNNFDFSTGFHLNYYQRQHTGSEKTLGELYQNTGFRREASIFTKASYQWNKVIFLLDLQYRYSDFNYKGSVNWEGVDWYFFNPKFGITFQASNKVDLYYSIGRTGREPTRNDIFLGNDDLPVNNLGMPALASTDAEYVIVQELGIRFREEKFSFNANLYYMNFDNEIVLSGQFGPNALALTNNVAQSFRSGLEIDFRWNITKQLTLINNTSFSYNRIEQESITFQPILTPNLIISQQIIYQPQNFTFGIDMRYQDDSYIDFANENTIGSYFLVNASAAYRFKSLELILRVNNVFDEKYYNNAYVDFDNSVKYFVQAPINYMLSLRWKI